jgi:hypothetical protein
VASPGRKSAFVHRCGGSPHDVFEYRNVPLLQNAPKLILTAFGWAIQYKEISVQPWKEKRAWGAAPLQCHPHRTSYPKLSPRVPKWQTDSFSETTRFFSDQQRYEAGVLWVKDNINLSDNHQGALMWVRRTIVVKQWRVGQNYLPRDGPELQPGFCREVVGRAVEADTLLQLFLTLNIIAAACQNSFFVILCVLKLGWGGEKIVKQEYTGFWQRQLNILYLCSCVHNLLELTK